MKIPTFEAIIDNDELGINVISWVSNPATQVDMYLFSAQDKKELSFADEEKHMVTSVVMLADTKIYREYEGSPFYITYSKDTLKQMAQKMLSDGTFNTCSFEHNGEILEPGQIQLVELYTTDELKKAPFNVPEGSLIATYKVMNDEIWEIFKSGEISGISIEGMFDLAEQKFNSAFQNIHQIESKNIKEKFMNILETLKQLIVDIEAEEQTPKEEVKPEEEVKKYDEINSKIESILADIETIKADVLANAERLTAIENILAETTVDPVEEIKEDENKDEKYSKYSKLFKNRNI